MKLQPIDPPRVFEVGRAPRVKISACARIELAPDEQVTFLTPQGAEYDVTQKSWGFYATPSLNGRLRGFGLQGALVKNSTGKFYVFLIEKGKEEECQRYLDLEGLSIICRFDSDGALQTLERRLQETSG